MQEGKQQSEGDCRLFIHACINIVCEHDSDRKAFSMPASTHSQLSNKTVVFPSNCQVKQSLKMSQI